MNLALEGQTRLEVAEPGLVRRVLTLLASLVVFGLAATRFLRVLATTINSDSLYLAGLYRDIFIDKVPIRAWDLQPAPSLFPDLPAFFLLRAITGSAAVATCAYGACELLVEVALLAAVLRALGLRDRWWAYSTSFLIVAALAYATSCSEFLQILFYPSIHSSSVWVGLASAVLVTWQLESGKWSLAGVSALAVLTALTAGFDSLYLLIAAAPLIAASLFCAVVFRRHRAVVLANAVALGAGVMMSVYVRPLPQRLGMIFPPKGAHLVFSWERLRDALHHWPPPGQPRVITLDVTLNFMAMAIVVVVLWRSLRGRTPAGELSREEAVFLSATFLGSECFTVLGVVLAGYYFEPGCARYLQPIFILPYMVVGAWFVLARTRVLRAWAAVYILFLVQNWPVTSHIAAIKDGTGLLYPASIACIDEVSRRYRAPYGYSDYWNARKTTEVSRAALRMLPVSGSFEAYSWIFNRIWFDRGPSKNSAFLVLPAGLDEGQIKDKLGEPKHVEHCGGGAVWVYDGPPRNRPRPEIVW